MINKNARVNNRKYNRKKNRNNTKEKLGIIISTINSKGQINFNKIIRHSARRNIKVVEIVEFNQDDPIDTLTQLTGIINLIKKYEYQGKSINLIMKEYSYNYILQLISQYVITPKTKRKLDF